MGVPHGILVRADSISGDGENQGCEEVVVMLEEDTIDIRLNDDDNTIIMVSFDEIEEGLRTLKRWRRES